MAVNDKVYIQTTSEVVKNTTGTDYAPGKTLYVERGIVAAEDSSKVFVNTPVGAGGGGGGSTVSVTPHRDAVSQVAGTITTGGTAQVAIASNAQRRYFEIINISNSILYINVGGTATIDGIPLAPNGGSYYSDNMNVSTSAISIFGATTGQKFITLTF